MSDRLPRHHRFRPRKTRLPIRAAALSDPPARPIAIPCAPAPGPGESPWRSATAALSGSAAET